MWPTNPFFRICGIVPSRGCSRYLYCVVPVAASSFLIASFKLKMYDVFYDYLFFILPISVANVQHVLITNYNPEGFQSILADLKEVDEQLREMGAIAEDGKLSKTIAIFITTQLTEFLIHIYWQGTTLINSVLIVTLAFLTNAAWIQHMMFAQLVHTRFAALNDQLTRIAASADRTLLQILETRLDSVFRVHSSLHVIVTDVSSHFCIYNLLYMATRLYYITILAYDLLGDLTDSESTIDLHRVYLAAWLVILIVCQAAACNSCAKEANRTPQIVHRVLNDNSPLSLWEMIGQFSRFSRNHRVEFSVGGFFVFEMKLLTKLASMVFTYLTIAIQLKDVNLLGFGPNNATSSVNSTVN